MKIAVDAMGTDYGPRTVVEGAVLAVQSLGIEIVLVGDERSISRLLKAMRFKSPKLSIVHAGEVVSMKDAPAESLKKRGSSIAVAAQLVAHKEAAALVSAGNTGATVAATLTRWRKLPGIHRPAIATLLPTKKQPVVLLDVGANVDCKPIHLYQFALMGSVYVRHVLGRNNPRVGLLNIGSEEGKGDDLTLQTYPLLKSSSLNFAGNVEGRDILSGQFDVVVCDGFVGNALLKFGEGAAELILSSLKGELSKNVVTYLCAMAVKPAFKRFMKTVDYTEYGGAPLLGVNGVCIIGHGSSNPRAIMNAIRAAREAIEHHLNDHILERLAEPTPTFLEAST
jgi:glycerol-3-phosphate acyltransferase PlsX